MQQTSATWKGLWAAGARLEARAMIAGTEYPLMSAPVITRAAMQGGLSIGNAVSAMCQLSVMAGSTTIPKAAPVAVEMRLTDGETVSEWLPAGTFYISRRQRDPVNGILTLECYDALLRANALLSDAYPWTTNTGEEVTDDQGNVIMFHIQIPDDMTELLNVLLSVLELELDGRTQLVTGPAYVISGNKSTMTIRTALEQIAAANAGNWVVTPEGKLRLVPIVSAAGAAAATEDVARAAAITGSIDAGEVGTVTGIRFEADNAYVLLGNANGMVLPVNVNAAVAADLYDRIRGFTYQPCELDGAIYDPAAEIGDYLIGGANGEIASVLYSEVATLSAMYHGHVAAPMPEEQEDEYPYISANVQEIQAVRLQLAGLEASAIVNVDVEYAQNQSATTAPTTGWSTDAPTWRSGFYIWQRTATMTGEGTSYSDPVCLSDQDGGIVSIVEQFYLSASDAFPTSGEWSVIQPTWESGKYIWTRSQITRSNGDVSTTDPVLAKTINDTNQRVTTLDTSLNQEGIFNRLTNNGQAQGIYISNGQLYVSASYILSGILRLGGVNNGNGVLNILNSSGQVVGTWDNTGLSVNNGAFSVDTSGKLIAGNSELSGSLTCSGTYGATPGEVIIQGGSIRANKAGVKELWIAGSTFMALEGKDLYFVSNYPKLPHASVTLGANGNITVNATKILLYPTTANDGGIYVADFKGVDGDFTTADGKTVAVRRGLVVQIDT